MYVIVLLEIPYTCCIMEIGRNFSHYVTTITTNIPLSMKLHKSPFVLFLLGVVLGAVGLYALSGASPNRSLAGIDSFMGIEGPTQIRATVGKESETIYNAVEGWGPYSWSISKGSLPPGLNMVQPQSPDSFTGSSALVTGTPTTAGKYRFELLVRDSRGASARKTVTAVISK